MKAISKILILALISATTFTTSCIQGKYEVPEVDTIPVGDTITITKLWQMYDSLVAIGKTYKFTNDCSVFGHITMSDKLGNIYKSAYLQGNSDDSKAINLHLMSNGGLYEGDYVRINLKGLVLGDYSGMIQLDSVKVDDNIVKLATHQHLQPEIVEIENIGTGEYVGKLVEITGVQFEDLYVGKTYADKEGKKTINTYIQDKLGNRMIVRTSGYASFADEIIPRGSGSIVAIVSRYNTDYQLYIRNTKEVKLTERRFGEEDEVFSIDFANVAVGEFAVDGWENDNKQGTAKWQCVQAQDAKVLSISGNAGEQNETWLVTPAINLSEEAFWSFKTRMMTAGNSLKVKITTDGGQTWNDLAANIATTSDWAISGNINLSNYLGNVRIAFVFESPVGVAGKYFVDDFKIFR